MQGGLEALGINIEKCLVPLIPLSPETPEIAKNHTAPSKSLAQTTCPPCPLVPRPPRRKYRANLLHHAPPPPTPYPHLVSTTRPQPLPPRFMATRSPLYPPRLTGSRLALPPIPLALSAPKLRRRSPQTAAYNGLYPSFRNSKTFNFRTFPLISSRFSHFRQNNFANYSQSFAYVEENCGKSPNIPLYLPATRVHA